MLNQNQVECYVPDADLQKHPSLSDGLDRSIPLTAESSSSGRYSEIQCKGGSVSDRTLVHDVNFLGQNISDAKPGRASVDHRTQSYFEPLQCEGIGNRRSSLGGNRVSEIDLSFEHDHPDDGSVSLEGGIPLNYKPLCTGSRGLDTRSKGQCLNEVVQNNSFMKQDTYQRKFIGSEGLTSNCESSHTRSGRRENSGRREFLSNKTKVQQTDCVREQENPETAFHEHSIDRRMGLVTAFEPSPEWFRRPEEVDFEKRLLDFSKEEWSAEQNFRPVREELWPDKESPMPEIFRTSFPANPPPSRKKSSSGSSGLPSRTSLPTGFPSDAEKYSYSGYYGLPVQTSLPANSLPKFERSSSSGSYDLPVETSVTSVDFVVPGSHMFGSRSVSVMQSEEGMQVITEETVSHTIYDEVLEPDIPLSKNMTQNAASCYHNSDNYTTGTDFTDCSANRSAASVLGGLRRRRADDVIQEIMLSPDPDSTTVVRRAPSKATTSYLVGKTDRADIAGGWKPVCSQTVVRKPRNPCQNTVPSAGNEIQMPPQLSQDSLWSTFDGVTIQKSGTHGQLVLGPDKFGVAKKDQESISAQPASLSALKSGAGGKSGKMMQSSVSSVGYLNRGDRAYIHSGGPGMSKASSFGKRVESATVQNMEIKQTTGNGTGAVELMRRNGNSGVVAERFPSNKLDLPKKSSSVERFASDKVPNVEKNRSDNGKDGCQDVVSKWQKFQEIISTPQRPQKPVQTTSSSLVRNSDQRSFEHHQLRTPSTMSNLERTQTTTENIQYQGRPIQTTTSNPVRTQTTSSSLVRDSDQSPFQLESKQSRKLEVACVTPQVRQPLRALHLDHDIMENSLAEDGICLISVYST